MSQIGAGYELPLLLLGGFRQVVDGAHRRLAELGYPESRPAHGFAMQAIGPGSTASEVARELGVSKQAAAKTIETLERLDYVCRSTDPADARRKLVVPTARGIGMLAASAQAFDEVQAQWVQAAGREVVAGIRDGLTRLAGEQARRLDSLGWLGTD